MQTKLIVWAVLFCLLLGRVSSVVDVDDEDEDEQLLRRILQRKQQPEKRPQKEFRKGSLDQKSVETRAGRFDAPFRRTWCAY